MVQPGHGPASGSVTRSFLSATVMSSFIISSRAEAQGRDLHIFSLRQYPTATVVGGFNLGRLALTAQTFYRWLDLSDALLNYMFDGTTVRDVVLRRITLCKVDVLCYAMQGVEGPIIPRHSTEHLAPGTYGLFSSDGNPSKLVISSARNYARPFQDFKGAILRYSPELSRQDHIPAELMRLAAARDRGRCCITGRNDVSTEFVWIFPPLASQISSPDARFLFELHYAGLLIIFCQQDRKPFEYYRVLDNVITISSSLVNALNRNSLTVDVDDAKRVICFNDPPANAPKLPSNLPPLSPSGCNRFWRLNLQYTIAVFFLPATPRMNTPRTT
ncbi:hypothetical protein HMN09_00807300 [Mycena chlorophos]|uniref:Uncharacterized protein n=1 Tax=Mycena chlorophos TaxID=658473 RepID=A0A8H6WAQ8_MYCCL|nr:hypothetical protein HMN09_00807300 [Mycena chlorophos]